MAQTIKSTCTFVQKKDLQKSWSNNEWGGCQTKEKRAFMEREIRTIQISGLQVWSSTNYNISLEIPSLPLSGLHWMKQERGYTVCKIYGLWMVPPAKEWQYRGNCHQLRDCIAKLVEHLDLKPRDHWFKSRSSPEIFFAIFQTFWRNDDI